MATTPPTALPASSAEPSSTLTTKETTRTTELPTWDGKYPPLTTAWTMPEACGFTLDLDHPPNNGESPTVYIDWTIESGATTFSCYPPGMFEAGNSGTFSPASCPIGWYTVDNSESDTHTKTRTCCSKDYSISRSGSYCEKVDTGIVRPTAVTFVDSTHSYLQPSQMPIPITNATLAHHMMVIIFEAKDQDILGVQDSDILLDTPAAAKGRLSLGAKIGIGIGAATGFSILMFLLIWVFRRTRRHRRMRKSRPYELGGMGHRREGDICRSDQPSEETIGTQMEAVAVARQVHEADPPPAYEASPSQVSLDLVETARDPEDELRVLKAQQERIQLRIEELESGIVPEGDDPAVRGG